MIAALVIAFVTATQAPDAVAQAGPDESVTAADLLTPGQPALHGGCGDRRAGSTGLPIRLVACGAPLRTQQARDDWFGADKARHFAMSWAAVAYGYSTARLAGADPDPALAMAAAACLAAGLGKEISDWARGRGFSLRDLVWDLAGIGTSLIIMQRAG